MTLKKMLLLASMALAAMAFAAPAAQAETFWSNATGFETEGEITSDAGFQTGPGIVFFAGSVFNGETMGEGEITEAEIAEGPIPTNLPGCTAEGTINQASLPWPITLSTPDNISIGSATQPATFENHYSAGCAVFGVPSTVPVEGIVTGTVENIGGNACINLNPITDDMNVEPSGPPVNLTTPNGPVCIEGTEA